MRRFGRGVVGFEWVGELVAECLVQAIGIVKGFDASEYAESCVFEDFQRLVFGSLVCKRPEEAFHGGVVATVARAAHQALNA